MTVQTQYLPQLYSSSLSTWLRAKHAQKRKGLELEIEIRDRPESCRSRRSLQQTHNPVQGAVLFSVSNKHVLFCLPKPAQGLVSHHLRSSPPRTLIDAAVIFGTTPSCCFKGALSKDSDPLSADRARAAIGGTVGGGADAEAFIWGTETNAVGSFVAGAASVAALK